ncbi:hypothetical protein Ae406Ps2_3517c [Pseudonocardia sp. Ae406_Ps2]|nr:hypothetical protein Ae406Ps2_3517c [Pseudonocardia sp. Ae406_Ps2]OLM11598.1 hypothetical protein Ae505Ps2_1723 [Pseudonocardia sp. Ae505_Ps2]
MLLHPTPGFVVRGGSMIDDDTRPLTSWDGT